MLIHDFPQGEEQRSIISTIKSPFALFEVQIEGFFGDSVEPPKMSFRLIPEVLNAVDMIKFVLRKLFAVIDTHMMISLNIQ